MDFMKRGFTYLFIILLIVSIFHDLSLEKENIISFPPDTTLEHGGDYTIYKVNIAEGDTVLSIVEELNEPMNRNLSMDRIMHDFKVLNPEVDPYQLQARSYYYFPVYKSGD